MVVSSLTLGLFSLILKRSLGAAFLDRGARGAVWGFAFYGGALFSVASRGLFSRWDERSTSLVLVSHVHVNHLANSSECLRRDVLWDLYIVIHFNMREFLRDGFGWSDVASLLLRLVGESSGNCWLRVDFEKPVWATFCPFIVEDNVSHFVRWVVLFPVFDFRARVVRFLEQACCVLITWVGVLRLLCQTASFEELLPLFWMLLLREHFRVLAWEADVPRGLWIIIPACLWAAAPWWAFLLLLFNNCVWSISSPICIVILDQRVGDGDGSNLKRTLLSV